jgi:hypothetical protein
VSRWLRQSLFDDIGPEHAAVLDLASEVRTELREATSTSESPAWGIALNDALVDTVRRGDLDAARAALRCGLGLPETPTLEPAP